MPYFLREVYSNTKWDPNEFPSWLKDGELPSCLIRDLRANDNALSLWKIDDDKSNLPHVIAALVSGRKSSKTNFDYALLDENHLDELVFKPIMKVSTTAYCDMNSYHCDVPNLSINTVVYFAHLLNRHGKFDRMGWKDIQDQLKDAYKKGQLNLAKMETNLKQQLGVSE